MLGFNKAAAGTNKKSKRPLADTQNRYFRPKTRIASSCQLKLKNKIEYFKPMQYQFVALIIHINKYLHLQYAMH